MGMLLGIYSTGYAVADLAIAIVLIAAVIALVVIGLRALNIQLPQWLIQVLCVIAVAFVVILAIRFVVSL